jgi:xylulokinase
MDDLFLGIDCSTQDLTGIVIDITTKEVSWKHSISFDEDLPYYQTTNGVYFSNDGKTIHSNPLMWINALDLLLEQMRSNVQMISSIKAISGSGQQHGTVYLNASSQERLSHLNHHKKLSDQLKDLFSRLTSPVWMDSSTTKQCEEIRSSMGSMEQMIKVTGSNAVERFSGPQIRKFYQENPRAYENTRIIHLVSSFLASILIGKDAPIDHGDGAGMNLMNIETKQWDLNVLEATAPYLKSKLPFLCNSYDQIGTIHPYFSKRYGFNPETIIISWSGDNPNSLIGTGVIEQGKVGISLGTSDTYFAYMKDLFLDLKGEGHVFGAPTGDYMSLICYKNGSLVREKIKNDFNIDWLEFADILDTTPSGNNGCIMLPYFYPELVPLVLEPKVQRFGFTEKDKLSNVRGIIEAQFLSMRLHSEWIQEAPLEIHATGGASVNEAILQVLANIFQVPVRKFEISDSASLGAALRSAYSYYKHVKKPLSWQEIIQSFLGFERTTIIHPRIECATLYADMLELYRKYEDYVLRNGENPESNRKLFIEQYFK